MSDFPPLKKTVIVFWFILGGMLIAQGVAYALGSIPVFAGAAIFAPSLVEYLLLAWIGWIALYAIDTFDLIRRVGLKKLVQVWDSLDTTQSFLFVFLCVYVNAVLLMAGVIGLAVSSLFGVKAIALVVAMLYPNLDLTYAGDYYTPGRVAISLFLAVFHTFGVLRDLTSDNVVSGLEPDSIVGGLESNSTM